MMPMHSHNTSFILFGCIRENIDFFLTLVLYIKKRWRTTIDAHINMKEKKPTHNLTVSIGPTLL